jgi:23S rRNA (guanosine2251-2'-O)-methyltransferase
LTEDASFGNRCPRCLGATVAVFEGVLPGFEDRNAAAAPSSARFEALLDNVRSALNVGSIFRTAEGFGFGHIYLAGITPTPEDIEVRKTSLGAESSLPWSDHRNALDLLSTLKQRGREIWVLENVPEAIALDPRKISWANSAHVVLVVGNEVTGVDPGILAAADRALRLSMFGRKTSFNAAAAFAIAAYALTLA